MSDFQFGYVNDNDESLVSKGVSGVFGLNHGGIVVKLEYSDKTQKGEPTSAVIIEMLIDGGTFYRTIYDATGQKLFKGNETLNPGDEGYQAVYNDEMTQRTAYVVNLVKSLGVTDAQIQAAFTQPATSFADWANRLIGLVPKDFATKPVDVFLEYQWEIAEGRDRTYLQLPANMKGGRVFAQPQAGIPVNGKWEAVQNEKGLKYVDAAGNIHPFERNATFMDGNKANQQTEGGNALDAKTTSGNAKEADKEEW